MTSLSEIDLDSVAREIAAPPPPPEPSPELIAKAGAYLERRGWTRELAGEADFAAATLALARCSLDGLPGGANPPGEPRLDGDVSPHLQPARRRGTFAFGRYGSVESMVCWLDRKETAAAKERRFRNAMRRLPPNLRRFARALKRVLLSVPGPENLHREKIMKRLEIGRAMYYRLLSGVDKNLV